MRCLTSSACSTSKPAQRSSWHKTCHDCNNRGNLAACPSAHNGHLFLVSA